MEHTVTSQQEFHNNQQQTSPTTIMPSTIDLASKLATSSSPPPHPLSSSVVATTTEAKNQMIPVATAINDDSQSNPSATNMTDSFQSRFKALEKIVKSSPVIIGGQSINCELLIDLLNAIYLECQNTELTRNKSQQKFLEHVEPLAQQINQLRLQSKDFDLIKVIGFGNFGQVSVVRSKNDGQVYAMKTLNKIGLLRRAERACYKEERDILLHGSTHNWFTKLHYAFQDDTNLYLIMDYYIGGDLLTLFSKYDDCLPEEMSRFYSAQIIMALSTLHDMGYIHRDIKPDNILLDRHGHACLADFGSCLKVSDLASNGQCAVAVGTPDYISPDVLKAMEGGKKSGLIYGVDIDWWSLGVVIFESLFGETPFYAESLAETYSKIINHENCFKFPDEPQLSDDAKDLISHLVCSQPKRFSDISQFKTHKWFDGIDWDNLRNVTPPYQPVISGPEDTSNFDIDEDLSDNPHDPKKNIYTKGPKERYLDIHLPFVGFTATFSRLSDANCEQDSSFERDDNSTNLGAIDAIDGSSTITIAKQCKPTNMTTDNTHTEQSNNYNQMSDEMQQLERDLSLARQQWIELSSLVSDVRKEKFSLSSQLRCKESELEQQLEKMSDMRQSLASFEQTRRQQADKISSLSLELDRERQVSYGCRLEISKLEGRLQTIQSELALIQNSKLMNQDHNLDKLDDYDDPADLSGASSTAKDELISQQRDYISHLEEQVLQLQQKQPNWDKQVAAATNLDPENVYMNSYQVENMKLENSSSTTWQERRSAKAERHEFNELQLSLQNEIEEKRRIQNDLEDKKRELDQALADVAELKVELTCVLNEQQKRTNNSNNIRNTTVGSDQANFVAGPSVPSEPIRPMPMLSQSMLFNTNSSLTSEADFVASLKRDSSLSGQQNISSYQLASNLSTQSTYMGDFSSNSVAADEMGGYSEAESAYRQIRAHQQHPANQLDTRAQSSRYQVKSPPSMQLDSDRIYANQNAVTAAHQAMIQQQQQHQQHLQHNENLHQLSLQPNTSHNRHMFVVRTFIMPLKCNLCTSLMNGLIRQGLVCESCGFACHPICAKAAVNIACPYDDKKLIGLDPQRGIGTAYSGYVRIPRPGGVRKGWMRIYVVVCDFKLFLYDSGEGSGPSSTNTSLVGSSSGREDSLSNKTNTLQGVSVSRIIDLRDENFSVTSVLENDVIHASKQDISCIFRLSSTLNSDEYSNQSHHRVFYQLMLVDKESEKVKWIEALQGLHRIVKRNNLPSRNMLASYSILTANQFNQLRNMASVNCCSLVTIGEPEEKLLLIGADEALFSCYLQLNAYHKLPKESRIMQMEPIESEQLIVIMGGRQRHIKLLPMRGLENDSVAWIKMPETKNATTFVVHKDLPGSRSFISVAVKKSLYIYEITRRQYRYAPWREVQSNATIQSLNVSGSLVCVGTSSSFHVHNILAREGPPMYLVSSDCIDLAYIMQNSYEPMACYQVVAGEKWLLVFENHGIYVDSFGFKTQDPDLQFVTKCYAIASLSIESPTNDGQRLLLLLAFSPNHVNVYDTRDGEWLQTMNLKDTKPLQKDAKDKLICVTGAFDFPILIEITLRQRPQNRIVASNPFQSKPLTLKSNLVQKLSKLGSSEALELLQRKVSRVHISEPSDFQHVRHLGPANQPCLIDLNQIVPSTTSTSSSAVSRPTSIISSSHLVNSEPVSPTGTSNSNSNSNSNSGGKRDSNASVAG